MKRRFQISVRVLWIVTGVVIICIVTLFWCLSTYNHAINTSVSSDSTRLRFAIEEGESASHIATRLEEEEIILSSWAFKWYVHQHGLERDFKTGEYVLTRSMNIKEIIGKLTNPHGEGWVRILEGWRSEEIAEYLEQQGYVSSDTFMSCVKKCQYTYSFLDSKPSDQGLEGYLFPDSYIILSDTTEDEIIKKLLDNFDQKLTESMRKEITSQGRTIHEVVTMASMIEREARGDTDRKIVSGILWKRFDQNVHLGVDATVSYLLGDWRAPITSDDLDIDSPYNTRKFVGLPPGPIANPSLSSLNAAIYPQESDYWYYLTTPDTGEVIYSKTLDEHNENVAKYLR